MDNHLLAGDKFIHLSDAQEAVLKFAEKRLLLPLQGTLTFLSGTYGSGKTVLAIEIARIIAARRWQQQQEEIGDTKMEVKVTFVGGHRSELLRKSLQQQNKGMQIKSINEMCPSPT